MRRIILSGSLLLLPSFAMAQNVNSSFSLTLQGQYAHYQQDPKQYALPGFMLGGEAELTQAGLGLGHNELSFAANVDNVFSGKLTAAIADHDGKAELELEEAYIETLGLGQGVTFKAGRFMSNLGYLNNQHGHAHDFVDVPLVYRGLFGNQLIDDGLQLRWLAPTDVFLQMGMELGRGDRFPAGGAKGNGIASRTVFAELGGDINDSHSWQLGLSHWRARVAQRSAGGHDHGGASEIPSFQGKSRVSAFDAVWKWAPQGNYREQNFKLQFEYFVRNEQGRVNLLGSNPLEETDYQGKQYGWYSQAVYQFAQGWQIGARYDRLQSNNQGTDLSVLDEAGLLGNDHRPERQSLVFSYLPSEYHKFSLQVNRDRSQSSKDNQVLLQYVMSLGAHGAHQF